MRCRVTRRGTLDACSIIEEAPEGLGVGAAALSLAPLYRLKPGTVDGAPVEWPTIDIAINFHAPDDNVARNLLADEVAWGSAPTAKEMAEAFPVGAIGKVTSATVILRCSVWSDGGLHGCGAITEQPRDLGFAAAATSLIKRFHVYDGPGYADATYADVDVPFHFSDPRQPNPPRLTYPSWLQRPNPAQAARIFPPEAVKAGLKSGRAILSCQASHDGSLTDCSVVWEHPAGLGFGRAALALASVMKLNPWTPQGVPIDGASVHIPIRVDLASDNSPARAGGAGDATPPGAP